MGLILLHSAHASKAYKAVLGASGRLHGGWRIVRPDFEPEEITVCAPRHPIARGIENFTLPQEEMYGSPLGAPCWETLVFQSHFPRGGEDFPCGFALTVGRGIEPNPGRLPTVEQDGQIINGGGGQGQGAGRVFYFRPGDENVPTYHHPVVRQILVNAVMWAAHRNAGATP